MPGVRRVLLTGASGLVGLHVLPVLAGQGYEVHAASRRLPALLPAAARWHSCDLLDHRAAAALIDAVRPTHLLHGAWCVSPGAVWWDAANLDWCAATLRLVKGFTEAGGQRAVLVGTCAEYAWLGGACDEAATPLRPATLYGQAKESCRAALMPYAAAVGLSLAWVRLFNMYGPHEDPRRLVAAAITTLLRGERFECTDGRQRRDFLHVEDAAAGLAAVLGSGLAGAVNLGTGEAVTIRRVLEEVGHHLGAAGQIAFGARPRPAEEPDELVPALGRLHAALDWRPRHDLRSGVAHTLAWWRRQNAAVAGTA